MKVKLKKFTQFAREILPNEANYLATVVQFSDDEKCTIIAQLIANATSENNFTEFNESIDKRKYTYIKNWVKKKLSLIDVDATLAWFLDLKHKILVDTINASEEQQFLGYLLQYKKVDFNFQNLYELVKEYKSYLLIRMRYKDHQIVADFLRSYETHYQNSKKINDTLYHATQEITSQYTLNTTETRYWEKWLKKIFETNEIDGKNRYQAFVLLAFMYSNYNENNKLRVLFDTIDEYFSNGKLYSRRLLSNYYASRVLLHSKENQFAKAKYYGFLSIRLKNDDSLMYLNNLVAILLREKKADQTLALLEDYKWLYKETHNYHQKIGYVSYQVRALAQVGKYDLAETRARLFLKKHAQEILKHRWHHFFTSYFEVLIVNERYEIILKLNKKYCLQELELERQKRTTYVPNIFWSVSLAKYMEGSIDLDQLKVAVKSSIAEVAPSKSQRKLMIQVLENLSVNLPEVFLKLKSQLYQRA